MDELDLDSFIANIEETAPEENLGAKLACNECGGKLEEGEDGTLACPVCCVQADVLQFDETELHHDEEGRPVYGQRVVLGERLTRHQVDYGWSWSTDEAVAHILSLQLDALEQANLLTDLFRPAVTNMWLKFWLETIAPHIKDEFSGDELLPISAKLALKLRDVEVLFKIQDKIMVPLRSLRGTRDLKRIYRMVNAKFSTSNFKDDEQRSFDDDELSSESFDIGSMDRNPDELIQEFDRFSANDPIEPPEIEHQEVEPQQVESRGDEQQEVLSQASDVTKQDDEGGIPANDMNQLLESFTHQTQNLSKDYIKILTLNKTLAFIEATARCLPEDDPLFAADIIRACNQHLIPFYESSKLLPDNLQLNSRDRLLFQKTTPPTPIQLTRAASLLINNIYQAYLPKSLPVPNLNSILARFIKDLNLPKGLMDVIRDKVSFMQIPPTRPKEFTTLVNRRLPQYDRWAFAVLIFHLKVLFNMGQTYLDAQKLAAEKMSSQVKEDFFMMADWISQISEKLNWILRRDPCALYHPLCNLSKFEISPQLAKYVERQIDAKPYTNIRTRPGEVYSDPAYRNELVEALKNELGPATRLKCKLPEGEELETSSNIKYPVTDSFQRVEKICASLDFGPEVHLCRDYSSHIVVTLSNLPKWSILDGQKNNSRTNFQISPRWPLAYRKLVYIGAFMCYCQPEDLLMEIKTVEECLQPQPKVIRRKSQSSQ